MTALFLGGFEELLELLCANALLGKGASLDAGRADWACVQIPALLALGLRLIAPDLNLLTALLAPDVLRLGLADLYASWASFFEHNNILYHCGEISMMQIIRSSERTYSWRLPDPCHAFCSEPVCSSITAAIAFSLCTERYVGQFPLQ